MLEPLNSFTTSAADFADKPNSGMSAAEVKAQFDAAPEELRVFVNNLITQLNTDFALKSEIATALLGQILDGSLTDAKLSNATDQVKDRLTKDITDLATFKATKGQPNGFASLGGDGKVISSQLGISIKTGAISNGGTIPQTAGYANYIYFVSINNVIYKLFVGSGNYDTNFYCSVNQSTRVVTVKTSYSGDYAGTANYIEIAW